MLLNSNKLIYEMKVFQEISIKLNFVWNIFDKKHIELIFINKFIWSFHAFKYVYIILKFSKLYVSITIYVSIPHNKE